LRRLGHNIWYAIRQSGCRRRLQIGARALDARSQLSVTGWRAKKKRRPQAALRRLRCLYGLMFRIAIALASVSTDS
jgi:hypothetical protein